MDTMQLVQVREVDGSLRVGLVEDGAVLDLTRADPVLAGSALRLVEAGQNRLLPILQRLRAGLGASRPAWRYERLDRPPGTGPHLLAPVQAPEVWGAGVTFERSRQARVGETLADADVYSRVYEADRPELFLKTSNMLRVVGPHGRIGVRSDSRWTVPEPELALVIGPDGRIAAYTAGIDVTARDIEAANPLYLPQAKIFRGCCALGPTLVVSDDRVDIAGWTVRLRISTSTSVRFQAAVSLAKMRRSPQELIEYLCRDNEVLPGTVLLAGTGIVPEDDLALEPGDVVEVSVGPVGTLTVGVGAQHEAAAGAG